MIPIKPLEPKYLEVLLTSNPSKFSDDVYPYQNTVIISSSSKNQPSYEYNNEYIKQRPYTIFDQPSAILVFNINSQGSINILHSINSEDNEIIASNLPKLIPEGHKIPISAPFGLEQIIFVALSSPLTNLKLNEMSNLFSSSNSTISSPETKKLSKIIENRATAIHELNLQTFPAEVDKSI